MAMNGECDGDREGEMSVRSPGKRKKRHSPFRSYNRSSNGSCGAPTYRQRLNNELCSSVSSIRPSKGDIDGIEYGCRDISYIGGSCGDPTPRKKRQVGELLSFTSFPEFLPSVSGVGCSPEGKGESESGKAVICGGDVGETAPATNQQQDGGGTDTTTPPTPPLMERGNNTTTNNNNSNNNNNNSMWFDEGEVSQDATNAVARLSFSPGLGQASKNMPSSYVMPSPIPVRRGCTPSKALGGEKSLSSALAPSSSGLQFTSGAEYKDVGAPPREEFEEMDMRCSPSQDEECSRSSFPLCSQNAAAYTPNMRLDLQGCSQSGMNYPDDTRSRRGSVGSLGRLNSIDIGIRSSQDTDLLASSLRLDAQAFSQGCGNGEAYMNDVASPAPIFSHPPPPPPQYDAPTPLSSLNSEDLAALPFPSEAQATFPQGWGKEERGKSFELMHRCIEEEELERTTIEAHGGGDHRGSAATVDLDWEQRGEGGGGDVECQGVVVGGDEHERCECRGSIERDGETESGRSSPFFFGDEEALPGLQDPLFGLNGSQNLPGIRGGGSLLHTPSSSFGSLLEFRDWNKTPSLDSNGRETPNSQTMACPPTPERNPVWLNSIENVSGRGGDEGNGGARSSASWCTKGNGRQSGRLVRRNSLQITKLLAGRSAKGRRTASNNIRFYRDFVNLGIIGQGQFALVYKVRSLLDGGRLYAVKRSKKMFRSKADRARSMQEVLNLQRMADCLYVVHFERAWQEEGLFYYQAELCELGNLQTVVKHVIRGGKTIPNSSLWKVAHDVGEGLHFLHENNLVHLDVKPSNIFLCLSGRLKLGDFGLAVAFGTADIDSEGDICYMAKELLETSERYPSADMFSMGITLYAMAAGMLELPMRGQGWHDLREGNPPPLPKDCCPRLREVVALLVHPNPKERLTADALRQEPLASVVEEVDAFLLDEGKAAAKGFSSSTANVSKKGGKVMNNKSTGNNVANSTPRQCRYSSKVKSIIEKVTPKGGLAAGVQPTPLGRWKDL